MIEIKDPWTYSWGWFSARFLNCFAHSVNHKVTKAKGKTDIFIIASPQNHTFWTNDQVVSGPHQNDKSHVGCTDIATRYAIH